MKWRRFVSVAFAAALFLVLGLGIYAAHVRSSARALINSAKAIRSTADAQREIAIWQTRSRESSWEQTSPQAEDRTFDTRVENGLLHYLQICPPTAAALTITMRNGQLRSIILVMFTGSEPNATPGVWVQEWFDFGTATDFYVKQKDKPWKVTVEFSSSEPEVEREKAFALNADCLVKPNGCRSAQEILPDLRQLAGSVPGLQTQSYP